MDNQLPDQLEEDEDLDSEALADPDDLDDEQVDPDDDVDAEEGEEEDGEDEEKRVDGISLDALEVEELDEVEKTESATMLVDETTEIREIRRSEMNLDIETEGMKGDEFVCKSCFLLLKRVQLAEGQDQICRDCA